MEEYFEVLKPDCKCAFLYRPDTPDDLLEIVEKIHRKPAAEVISVLGKDLIKIGDTTLSVENKIAETYGKRFLSVYFYKDVKK